MSTQTLSFYFSQIYQQVKLLQSYTVRNLISIPKRCQTSIIYFKYFVYTQLSHPFLLFFDFGVAEGAQDCGTACEKVCFGKIENVKDSGH